MNKLSNSSFKDFNEDWTSHPAIQWIISYKQMIGWGLAAFTAFLIGTFFFLSQRTLSHEQDVFQAQNLFTQFQDAKTPDEQSVAYQELKNVIHRYPELEAKYGGYLAQALLIVGDAPQAKEWAQGIFKRTTSDHLQLYQQYAQTSLLIADQAYDQALSQAQNLKEKLQQTNQLEDHSELYLFNLLRLATLYQQLNQPEAESQIWEEMQNQSSHLATLSQSIKIGQASLEHYINESRKNINQ